MAVELGPSGLMTVGKPSQQVGAVFRQPLVTKKRRARRRRRRQPQPKPTPQVKEVQPSPPKQEKVFGLTTIQLRDKRQKVKTKKKSRFDVGRFIFKDKKQVPILLQRINDDLEQKVLPKIYGDSPAQREGKEFSLRYSQMYGGRKLNQLFYKTKLGKKVTKGAKKFEQTDVGKTVVGIAQPIVEESLTFAALGPWLKTGGEIRQGLLAKEVKTLGKQTSSLGVKVKKGGKSDLIVKTQSNTPNFRLESVNRYTIDPLTKGKVLVRGGKGATKIINKNTGRQVGKTLEYTFSGAGKTTDAKLLKVVAQSLKGKKVAEYGKVLAKIKKAGGVGKVKITTKDLKTIKRTFGGVFKQNKDIEKAITGTIKKSGKLSVRVKPKDVSVVKDITNLLKKSNIQTVNKLPIKAGKIQLKPVSKSSLKSINQFIKDISKSAKTTSPSKISKILKSPSKVKKFLGKSKANKLSKIKEGLGAGFGATVAQATSKATIKTTGLTKAATIKPITKVSPSKTVIQRKKFTPPKKTQVKRKQEAILLKKKKKEDTTQISKTKTDTKTKEDTKQKSKSKTIQKKRQEQKTEKKQKRVIPKPTITIERPPIRILPAVRARPKVGKTKIVKVKLKKTKQRLKKKKKKGKLGYNAYAKSGKRFFKINKLPLSKAGARNRMAYAVDNTTSRTGKIKAVGRVKKLGKVRKKEQGYYGKTKRKYKKKKKRFIERTKNAIDTRGEKKGLTLAKFRKRLNIGKTKKKKGGNKK